MRVVLGATALTLAASLAPCQERIYVANNQPSRFYSLSFDGAAFSADDLDPAAPGNGVGGGVGPWDGGFFVSDHLFLNATGLQNLGLAVFDPFHKAELPRVRSTVTFGGLALSPAGDFAYVVGPNGTSVATLSVIDLRPSSANYLKEIAASSMGGETLTGFDAAIALGPGGTKLYVALFGGSWGQNSRVKVFDLSSPQAPSLLFTTDVPRSSNEVSFGSSSRGLAAATLGGSPYLVLRRYDLQIVPILGSGNIDPAALVQTSATFNGTGQWVMTDAYATDTAGGPRLFATADKYDVNGGVTEEDVLVVDLAAGLVGQVAFTPAGGSSDQEHLAGSLSGSYLYAVSPGTLGVESPVKVHALSLADVPALLATTTLDADVSPSLTFLAVRNQIGPAPAPTINDASVNGGGSVLSNDAVRTVTFDGSGLSNVAHVFSGLSRMTLTGASNSQVTASSPVGLPTGNRPMLLVDGSGGIARFDGIRVSNAPSYKPAHVVYAGAVGEDRYYVLNASGATTDLPSFPTGVGPVRASVSGDGTKLFVSNFAGGSVTVHALVPGGGFDFYDTIADLPTGGVPQPQALAETPGRSRLYVSLLGRRLAIIDSQAVTLLATPDLGAVTSLGTVFQNIRGLAVSPDGGFLYATTPGNATRDAEIAAIDVGDDSIVQSDVTMNALPSPPQPQGRADLAINAAGTKLYYVSSKESAVRIFDVSGPTLTPALVVPIANVTPGTRHVAVLPDMRFYYVVSRSGSVHIYDAATDVIAATLNVGSAAELPVASPDSRFVYVPIAETGEVLTIDARPGSPTLHQIVAHTGAGVGGAAALAVGPGIATTAGTDVTVAPAPGVEVTFSDVSAAGNTSVTSSVASTLPFGVGYYSPTAIPVYYDLDTTATFTGPVEVCFAYDDTGLSAQDEASLKVLHEEGGQLVDRTSSLDTVANRICAEVTSFSQFAVVTSHETSICSTLSASRGGHRDSDIFSLSGAAGEQVVMTLKENGTGNTGTRARLTLLRARARPAAGALPLQVSGTLPATHGYKLVVAGVGRNGYVGGYCVALRSGSSAYTTLAPSQSVE